MKVLVQRVLNASVEVGGRKVSAVGKGILAFVGVEKDDTAAHAAWMAQKICALRIFEDENGKMNLSVRDIGGEILAVSQFTLCADTTRGNRPGFERAAFPEDARKLYEEFVTRIREIGIPAQNRNFSGRYAG